ncbi:MAG TPA: PIG-L family deacetylase, partial [Candidatus Lustribacter sp.]|nr:PIG-L family deacetylase [Candidatus Lustribacter sp.]
MPHTLVAFHAHPDDEALLTSGTMACAAARGHRVVLVLATDGGLGLAASAFTSDGQLAQRRRVEAVQSARALGVARVAHLGYADSGLGGSGLGGNRLGGSGLGDSGLGDSGSTAQGQGAFAHADPEEAARALARILREEEAEVLLTYDANGGYGHPDHVMVHHVGASAAALVGTPRVLQATVPRDTICRGVRLAGLLYRFPPDFDPTSFERAYSPSSV